MKFGIKRHEKWPGITERISIHGYIDNIVYLMIMFVNMEAFKSTVR